MEEANWGLQNKAEQIHALDLWQEETESVEKKTEINWRFERGDESDAVWGGGEERERENATVTWTIFLPSLFPVIK